MPCVIVVVGGMIFFFEIIASSNRTAHISPTGEPRMHGCFDASLCIDLSRRIRHFRILWRSAAWAVPNVIVVVIIIVGGRGGETRQPTRIARTHCTRPSAMVC